MNNKKKISEKICGICRICGTFDHMKQSNKPKSKTSRLKKPIQVKLRLDEPTLNRVDKSVKRMNMINGYNYKSRISRNEWINMAIQHYIDDAQPKKQI